MVTVDLVWQAHQVCGTCCRKVLKVQSLEIFKSLLKTHLFKIAFLGLYFLYIFRHKRFYCTAPLNGFASKGALVNILLRRLIKYKVTGIAVAAL